MKKSKGAIKHDGCDGGQGDISISSSKKDDEKDALTGRIDRVNNFLFSLRVWFKVAPNLSRTTGATCEMRCKGNCIGDF